MPRRSPGRAGASASYARLLLPETAEAKLSEPIAQIEGADRVTPRIGPVEEARVHARLLHALTRLLDLERAAGEREAGEADGAEARASALGGPEQLDVDLRREDLLHAAHEAPAGQRIVVRVKE